VKDGVVFFYFMPKKRLSQLLLIILLLGAGLLASGRMPVRSGAPPYGESEPDASVGDEFFWLKNWRRSEGPPKVALQVGHWKNSELPDELARLRGNTGASGGGKNEWEVNLEIAQKTAELLRAEGVTVKILPSTVPEKFWADVFVAIHADGSLDRAKSGFKIAAPWRDFTGKADNLVSTLRSIYQEKTGLAWDDNITRNMRGYYAFAWWRYDHAIHPMTTAVIVETGFLTNRSDQDLLIHHAGIPASAIAEGVLSHLAAEGLITS
jgi:N-acetylmuramoyl-L-alanine amidase